MSKIIKYLFKTQAEREVRHHVVITGTGRAGTTFLMELLTSLGLNTGYRMEDLTDIMKSHSKAGLERDIRSDTAPYVIKSPWFCKYSAEIINNDKIVLDHVFLPIRELEAAAASRIRVIQEHPPTELKPSQIIGGLMGTDNIEEQENILMRDIYTLLNALADSYIPVTLLSFPRFVSDPDYCYRKLRPLISRKGFPEFKRAFDTVCHPEWVHDFASRVGR